MKKWDLVEVPEKAFKNHVAEYTGVLVGEATASLLEFDTMETHYFVESEEGTYIGSSKINQYGLTYFIPVVYDEA